MEDLKEAAKSVYLRTVNSLDLGTVIKEKVRAEDDVLIVGEEEINLSNYKEVVLVGFGKASILMGAAIENMLGNRIKKGILVTNRRSGIRINSQVIVAGHPFPDANSFRAGEEVLKIIQSCDSDSLVIFLISGGGSSLVEVPLLEQVTPEDMKDLNRVLVNSGGTIREINVLRKHFSSIKGAVLGFWQED